jgi:hypothetical protein
MASPFCRSHAPAESFVYQGKVVRLAVENEKSGLPQVEVKSIKLSAPRLANADNSSPDRHIATRTLSMSLLKDGEPRDLSGDCVCLHHPFEDGSEWMNCEIELPRLNQDQKNIQRKIKLKTFLPWKRIDVSVHAFITENCSGEDKSQSLCEVPVLAESFDFETELSEPLL